MKHILVILLSSVLSVNMQPNLPVLTESMLQGNNGRFVVKKDYSLAGKSLKVPEGLTLVFSGGSLDNGKLVGNNSSVEVKQSKPAFGLNMAIAGLWNVPEVHDGWFAFDSSPDFISNQVIDNMLAFSNDSTPCHLFFEEDRTYYFELPYNGRKDLGNTFSHRIEDGKKRRNYWEVLNDDYAFLRIFTIPSNTHVTINNKLKMLPTSLGAYFIFWEYGKENVTVDGTGTIAGDNDWHRYDAPFTGKSYGEWGYIFRCIRCTNFTFKDITLSDAFGDCIHYSGSVYPDEKNPRWGSNLTLDNVKILRARRNGVAIGARNVRVRNCHFEGCGTDAVRGTAPKSAIDFEPDHVRYYPEIGNQDVLMERCTFKNNHFDMSSSLNTVKAYGKTARCHRWIRTSGHGVGY